MTGWYDAAGRGLRLLPPEAAHRLAVRALAAGLVPHPKRRDFPLLQTRLWGRDFSSPIGLAAGFDKDAEAIDGLLAPIGQYKGTALAMVMGVLSSMLSGASYGTELGDMEAGPTAGQDGHFVAAIHVAAFEDPTRFRSEERRVGKECRSRWSPDP